MALKKVNPDSLLEIGKLASFLLETFPHETRNEAAVDAAIRIISELRAIQAITEQRTAAWDELESHKRTVNKLALFFRDRYSREIMDGKHNQFADCADAAIHYMMVERDLTQRGWWGRLKYILWGV